MNTGYRLSKAGSVLLILSSVLTTGYSGMLDGVKLQNDVEYWTGEYGMDRIDKAGFVLQPTDYEEIYDAYYDYCESPSTPVFITTDLTLHTLHILVDHSVRIIEVEELLPRLEDLTAGMLEHAVKDYESADPELAEAARVQLLYFAVGARLLGLEVDLNDEDMKVVADELAKIEEHYGFEQVGFLPPVVVEDYSQYVPRGHYTRSDDLKRYFKAMMWFGRLPLHVPREDKSVMPMQAALMMSLNLENDPELAELWQEIYQPTRFFFGEAEDLTPEQIIAQARVFYGSDLKSERFADEDMLREFAAVLSEECRPKILSELVFVNGKKTIEVPLSLRFMPQRFVPDSYIFSQLVFSNVTDYQGQASYEPVPGGVRATEQTSRRPFTWGMTEYGPMRVFPRGLDVMAVLGWDNAEVILRKDGDMEYANYEQQFFKMMDWYDSLPDEEKESSIYYRWFDLFTVYYHASIPDLVDATAWERKKLMTALGSWTELRHDAILYAKQSYTVGAECAPPPPLRLAVIEQAPEVYSRMSECARVIADFSQDTREHQIKSTFIEFAEILDQMAVLAEKQAGGLPLTAEEHRWLWNVSGSMANLQYTLGNVVSSDEDNRMALVADVHTDVNSGQVLEEATGNPAALYVLVEIDGKTYVAQGATFTYYEFKQSMADRLTDGAWQQMLENGVAPDMPAWTGLMF